MTKIEAKMEPNFNLFSFSFYDYIGDTWRLCYNITTVDEMCYWLTKGKFEIYDVITHVCWTIKGKKILRHETPLMIHCNNGNIEICKYLISKGADYKLNIDGRTPFSIICENGHIDLFDYFTNDLKINLKTEPEALPTACFYGQLDIVVKLLNLGCSINCEATNNVCKYPIEFQSKSIMYHLILAGANLNAQDRKGNTALHYAVKHCKPDLVKLLIDMDVNTCIKNKKGYSALQLNFVIDEEITESGNKERERITQYFLDIDDK